MATKATHQKSKGKAETKELREFIETRDWTGALTLLEFQRKMGPLPTGQQPTSPDQQKEEKLENPLWLPYSAFHAGDYKRAAKLYRDEIASPANKGPEGGELNFHLHTYLACCLFFLRQYKEAQEEAEKDIKGEEIPLSNRLKFHLAHKFNDEQKLMQFHQKLQDTIEDQLCLASIHYLRSHFQEAIDIYKRFLLDHKDYLALNVYVALCYYKLDYFDVSHEVLNVYLQGQPESPAAINLKACNHFKSYNGKAGETELKRLTELISSSTPVAPSSQGIPAGAAQSQASDLVRHNMVVFRNGEGAQQTLPPLLNVVPEAQLNLVVYHLKNDDVDEAFNLIKDLEPATSQEYTIKGVVNSAYGQKHGSREHLKLAQQYFQLVGSSPTECDTIPGRQAMASCFFLLRQFEDVLIYLNSIKSYFTNDDDFNWDYGIAKASQGDFRGAEEALLLVQNEQYRADYVYISWLARCFIMNGKAYQAWDLYLKMETSPDSFSLLQLIGNDSYKMGAFYYSAKAFDVLERLDSSPEYWVGKRGACVGVFQQVIANEESKEHLRDIVGMLKTSHNPQVESILKVIRKWGRENGVKL